jgi:hypothetical protein
MKPKAFFAAMKEHPALQVIGTTPNPPTMLVIHDTPEGPRDRALSMPGLLKATWPQIEAFLTGRDTTRVEDVQL